MGIGQVGDDLAKPHAPAQAQGQAGTSGALAGGCRSSELLTWLGIEEDGGEAAGEVELALRHVPAGRSLTLEGGPVRCLHVVIRGGLKRIRTQPDGSEEVLAFAFCGDVIGLDRLPDGRHASGSVALEETWVAVLPRHELVPGAPGRAALERLLQHGARRAQVGRELE